MFSLEETKNIALRSAAPAIEYYQRRGDVFGEIQLAYTNGNILTFAIPVPALQEQGWVPGALMISVNQETGQVIKEISVPDDEDDK